MKGRQLLMEEEASKVRACSPEQGAGTVAWKWLPGRRSRPDGGLGPQSEGGSAQLAFRTAGDGGRFVPSASPALNMSVYRR